MPKGKDKLQTIDEKYPDAQKKKFALATPEQPEDEAKKDQVMEALGEQPEQREVRHLVETGNKQNLILEGDPERQIEYAQKASRALMQIIESKPKKVMISGEQYIEYEDWQILGRFYGATVGIEWTKPVVVNGKTWGYEARALVYRGETVISAAEAMCTRSERNWARRDEFMLRSMAQTRASAKALRNVFAWVAVMAASNLHLLRKWTVLLRKRNRSLHRNRVKKFRSLIS